MGWERICRGPISAVRLCDVPELAVNHTTAGAEQSPTNQEELESPAAASSSSVPPSTEDYPVAVCEVQIIEEVHFGEVWPSRPINVIPFSNAQADASYFRPTSPPITLQDVDPCGLSEFESGMALVRSINQSRAGSQVDDRLGRLGLSIPNTANETSLPDVQAGEIATMAPPPPSTPKPSPPPTPSNHPPRFRPVGESSPSLLPDLPLLSRRPNFLAPLKAVPVISRSYTD